MTLPRKVCDVVAGFSFWRKLEAGLKCSPMIMGVLVKCIYVVCECRVRMDIPVILGHW